MKVSIPQQFVSRFRYAKCWDHTVSVSIDPEVAEWLEQNCAGRYRLVEAERVEIEFLDEQDAVMFALAWWG